jgi:hypothetical protein
MTKHTFTSASSSLLTVALLLGAAACDEYPLHDLGYTTGNLPGSTEEPPEPEPGPPVAGLVTDFLGVWIGEAEDPLALQSNADGSPSLYRFPSGSTRIRLEFTQVEGFVTASLAFGGAPPPPPATDPDVGYPLDPEFDVTGRGAIDRGVLPPTEGVVHDAAVLMIMGRDHDALGTDGVGEGPLDEKLVADGKVNLLYNTAQVLSSWCALQTEESCPSDEQISWNDAGECLSGLDFTPMDCQKMSMCYRGLCTCSESGEVCRNAIDWPSFLTVRFSDEDSLVGLFSGGVFVNERGFEQPVGAVRFRRAESY